MTRDRSFQKGQKVKAFRRLTYLSPLAKYLEAWSPVANFGPSSFVDSLKTSTSIGVLSDALV
uniref:Uncharacterized protein n=1 Tax=Utricularia reniformis TaxID=192314 RepID=A0A1Y0AYY6_9LAMI|nr:hypothetical protein AEK19_MT0909 [Utricularia reniformis]ART30329.1 hypothetical protein AEK19_MT0909 [Utricularia reniformis]